MELILCCVPSLSPCCMHGQVTLCTCALTRSAPSSRGSTRCGLTPSKPPRWLILCKLIPEFFFAYENVGSIVRKLCNCLQSCEAPSYPPTLSHSHMYAVTTLGSMARGLCGQMKSFTSPRGCFTSENCS